MVRFIERATTIVLGILYLVLVIMCLIIHFVTVVIALGTSGLVAAFITFVLPVVAEIYWFIAIWHETGTVLNPYCLGILAYLGLLICFYTGGAVAAKVLGFDDS